MLIGEGYYMLQPLANLIDNPAMINLIGITFEVYGKLQVNIIPVDPSGSEDLPDEMIPDEPEDLIDQRMDYVVQIENATDLPQNFCRDTFVEYQLYLNDEKFRTDTIKGSDRNPTFGYSKHHTQEWITDGFIKYLKEDYLVFRVYGFADIKKQAGYGKDKESKASTSMNKGKQNSSMSKDNSLEQSNNSTIDLSTEAIK